MSNTERINKLIRTHNILPSNMKIKCFHHTSIVSTIGLLLLNIIKCYSQSSKKIAKMFLYFYILILYSYFFIYKTKFHI